MASEDGRTKTKNNKIEITILNTSVGKDGKLLDDITVGKSMYEWSLDSNSIEIPLENNGIDKDGNRFDLNTKKVISKKGNKELPKGNKKANIKDDDELTQ